MEILDLIQILSDPVQGCNLVYKIENGLVENIEVKRYFKYSDRTLAYALYDQIYEFTFCDLGDIKCDIIEINGSYRLTLKMNVKHLHGFVGNLYYP